MTDQHRFLKYSLFIICIWMTINFFPGSYNVDTWYQYFEMEKNDYDDWHSPWMAFLWRILYVNTDRFFSLYLLQMAWYFTFFYYLLKPVNNKLLLLIGIAASIWFTFIPQYLMKDLHLALAWACGLLIVMYTNNNQPAYAKYLGLLLLLYGLFIRPNSVLALIPILYLYIETYFVKKPGTLRKTFVTVGVSLLFFGAYFVGTYNLLHARRAYPEYKLKLMDIIGITKLSGQNYVPTCITTFSNYDHANTLLLYTPATIDHIYWPYDGVALLPPPDENINKCVTQAWKKAIAEQPYFYFKNRSKGFLYYLKIWRRVQPEEYWNITVSIVKNNFIPIDDHHTAFTQKILSLWNKMDKVHFYDPWVWLLLNTVLLIVFSMKYRKRKLYYYKALAALQLSGIVFMLGMWPVFQIDRDFRYTYWNLFVFIISFFYLGKKYLSLSTAPDMQE
jgi:hypothetical protein